MDTTLWILQWTLAALFLMAGMVKLIQPKEKMAKKMGWVNDFSGGTIKLIGLAEVLGALGLVLPMLTAILPILTPLAAAGLALLMLGASTTHIKRKEYQMLIMNAILFAGAFFIFYGRMFL